jgi:hypothetical protein
LGEGSIDPIAACAGLAVLTAFLTHGTLDCFLQSHAVMFTFWLAMGTAFAPMGSSPVSAAKATGWGE